MAAASSTPRRPIGPARYPAASAPTSAPSGTAAVISPSAVAVMVKSCFRGASAPAMTPSSKPNRKPAMAATAATIQIMISPEPFLLRAVPSGRHR